MGDKDMMKSLYANDGCQIKYREHGKADADPLILVGILSYSLVTDINETYATDTRLYWIFRGFQEDC
jgi:hypothetical protein